MNTDTKRHLSVNRVRHVGNFDGLGLKGAPRIFGGMTDNGSLRGALWLALAGRIRGLPVTSEFDLSALDDGTLVRAKGTVCVKEGLPSTEGGAFRRVAFSVLSLRGLTRVFNLVYEAAVDFELELERGHPIAVETAGAMLVRPRGWAFRASWIPPESPVVLPLPPVVRKRLEGAHNTIRRRYKGYLVRQGDVVEVFGVKGRTIDPNRDRLDRQPPLRSCIRSNGTNPLVVVAKKRGKRRRP